MSYGGRTRSRPHRAARDCTVQCTYESVRKVACTVYSVWRARWTCQHPAGGPACAVLITETWACWPGPGCPSKHGEFQKGLGGLLALFRFCHTGQSAARALVVVSCRTSWLASWGRFQKESSWLGRKGCRPHVVRSSEHWRDSCMERRARAKDGSPRRRDFPPGGTRVLPEAAVAIRPVPFSAPQLP